MSRQQTPDIMGDILGFNDRTPQVLRWDYTQAGTNAAKVQEYAAHIKRSEERATWEIIAAGEAFIAVKALLPHGQWSDWLDVEFGLTDRTAQRIMAVATAFSGKSDTVSLLSTSVLYLLAAPSTPKAARDQVIDVAATQPEPVTQTQAKAIIAEHKPAPRTVSPAPAGSGRTSKDREFYSAAPTPDQVDIIRKIIPPDLYERGWRIGLRPPDGRWILADGFHSTGLHDTLEAAIESARRQQDVWQSDPAPQVNGPTLPAWVTTDIAGWQIMINERTDPAWLAAELQRVGVGSDWMEALFDAYMGELLP